MNATAPREATDAQVNFIASLVRDRDPLAASQSTADWTANALAAYNAQPTARNASDAIEALKACPFRAKADAVTEPGMYRTADGSIYKVQKSRQSGNLYAKRLQPIGGQRIQDATGEVVNWEFVYAQGAMRELTAADRLSLEDAQAFGIRYGVCCVCGITLKDATSVAAGIGPVCGKRV